MASGTLDANSESFTVIVKKHQHARVRLNITATITVTADEGGVAFTLPNGNAAAWTSSDVIHIQTPGEYTFTASGVSGGSCVYDTLVYVVGL